MKRFLKTDDCRWPQVWLLTEGAEDSYNGFPMGEVYLTREGYNKLKEDLEKLRAEKQELSKMIGEAREQGDLRENAGYQYAREKQADVIRRMKELEDKLSNVRFIEDSKISKDEIRIGATVTYQNADNKEEFKYTFVGPEESDPSNGKLSVHSPLANPFLGHKVGDVVTVTLPTGQRKFKVLKIER
jgi:transcription elongation factor GreA